MQHLNYKELGTKLCQCSPPRELRLAILNDVWKVPCSLAINCSVNIYVVETLATCCLGVDVMRHM